MKKILFIAALLLSVAVNAQTGFDGKASDSKSKVLEKGRNYDKNYKVVNEEAKYKFGEDSLYKYIYNKLYTMPAYMANTTKGEIIIICEVNYDTKVQNVQLYQGIGNGVDDEVKQIVAGIKDFIPAKQNGIDYRSDMIINLPIKGR